MERMRSRVPVAVVMVWVLLAWALPVHTQESGSWKELKRESKRAKIDEMATEALQRILTSNEKARALFEHSYGWAAFDNLKIAVGLSGGGGNGVAVETKSGARTYMKMGSAGAGFSLGGKKYQLVFLFQDEQTYRSFVDKGWQASAEASAVAGTEGAGGQSGFVNGMATFMLNDTGLMASADIAGTKYWKNKKLND